GAGRIAGRARRGRRGAAVGSAKDLRGAGGESVARARRRRGLPGHQSRGRSRPLITQASATPRGAPRSVRLPGSRPGAVGGSDLGGAGALRWTRANRADVSTGTAGETS